MTFPTIPTGARVVTGVQTGTSGTRTFPSLTGLTKNAGDLLIAICVAYQTSTGTDAAFSGWGGGFTEFHDSATATTMAIGCAYKWSTGSETGTFTVTQAGTITGEAAFILLSIPGAHATTPPTAGARVSTATTTMADPGAFDPAGWAAEDTLWIAVGGDGETNATGSYTAIASGPANYTNYVDTGISSDTVGGVEGAVAFRQLNAASEDQGAWTADTSNSRHAALVIAVRPAPTVPGAPTAVLVAQTANTHEVDVDWTAPASDGGATITGYNVRWSSNAGSDWTEDGVEAGLSRLITGLAVVSHIFQAAAVNSIGQGAWSASSSGIIPNPWQTFSDGTSSSTGATVTGLTNDTVDYEFRVATVNASGQGAWSNIAGPYTPIIPVIERMKRWNGSSWVPIVLKHGASWAVVNHNDL